jgi:hypothetical protein
MTHQKIERGRGLGVAKEGVIVADCDIDYAIGKDGDDKPLAEGDNNDGNKYAEDCDIANGDNKYAFGDDSVVEPLAEGDDEYDTLSMLPTHEPALRVSTQACPHTKSIIFSALPAESMTPSAHAERASYSQHRPLRV